VIQMRRKWLALILVAIVCAVAVVPYGFREVRSDNAVGGVMWQKWRWGRIDAIDLDRNRDGRVDMRFKYTRRTLRFDNNAPEDVWEDTNFDGTFDRHVMYAAGRVVGVDVDTDGDGRYEQRMRGSGADELVRKHPPKFPPPQGR
jgi:hypothetical protein